MSTADLICTAGPVGDKPDLEKKLFRIAGLGAVGALVAWAGQPIMVTLAAQGEGGGEVTDCPSAVRGASRGGRGIGRRRGYRAR
jgi:hypothetical protein